MKFPATLAVFGTVFLCCTPAEGTGAEYRHESGLAFVYPDGWQLREADGLLLLSPTDPKPIGQLLIGAEALPLDVELNDPSVLLWFDEQAANLALGFERVGDPSYESGTLRLRYQGAEGRLLQVRAKRDESLGLFVAALEAGDAEARGQSQTVLEPVAREVFASYRFAGERDPALVGVWYRSEQAVSDVSYNSSGASYVSSSASIWYEFSADGRMLRRSSASVSGQGAGFGGVTSVSSSGPVAEGETGSWAADGEELDLLWDEGDHRRCPYRVFLDSEGQTALKLACGEKPRFFYRQ